MSNKKMNFFFSYSRDANPQIIEELLKQLSLVGFSMWYDKADVIIGHNINSDLNDTLNACCFCNGMVVVIDQTYLEKEWCLKELHFALEHNVSLYPILLQITKQELTDSASKLQELNLCTIKEISDIDYAVNKIAYRFITELQIIPKKYIHKAEYQILEKLVHTFYSYNQHDPTVLFICDNIFLCMQWILGQENYQWQHDDLILFNLVHNSLKNYMITNYSSMLEIQTAVLSTKRIIDAYIYSN